MKTSLSIRNRGQAAGYTGMGACLLCLFFASGIALAGCEDDSLAGLSSGNEGKKTKGGFDGSIPNAGAANIREKFGIATTGTQGVTDTFNALHDFIQHGGLTEEQDIIRLGDYIGLEGGLQVTAYGEGLNAGLINISPLAQSQADMAPLRDAPVSPGPPDLPDADLLRLFVVGINSFHSGKGASGQYNLEANDGTPHIVLQFQNVPGHRRMNATDTNSGGYRDSEMRRYLTPVTGDAGSGKFYQGLREAGVPDTVFWEPMRCLSDSGKNPANFQVVKDKVWLPTEREMFGEQFLSGNPETAVNQARLEYYTDNAKRVKREKNAGNATAYWLASPLASLTEARIDAQYEATPSNYSYTVPNPLAGDENEPDTITLTGREAVAALCDERYSTDFCEVINTGVYSRHKAVAAPARTSLGIVPAFCVK